MGPLNLEGLPDDSLLLVDTAPIIYTLERHPTFGPYFQPLFDAHAAGKLRFAVTTVSIAEVLAGPFKARKDDLAWQYRMVLESWRVIPLTVDIAESAARFRVENGLRLPDAIQLASAVAIHAFVLV